jgi:hypothetical protein
MDLLELVAREEIRDLVARYAHLADRGRFADLAALFTADGVLEPGEEPAAHGRAAIEAFLGGTGQDLAAARPLRLIRHYVANHRIEIDAPQRARGEAYFLVVTDRGVDHWGRYRDEYRREGDRWLFARRRARLDGFAPDSWSAERRRASAPCS